MYLLDTHAIIWYVSGNIELSAKARQLMDSRKCFFSYASLWEIAIKQAKGTLEFNKYLESKLSLPTPAKVLILIE